MLLDIIRFAQRYYFFVIGIAQAKLAWTTERIKRTGKIADADAGNYYSCIWLGWSALDLAQARAFRNCVQACIYLFPRWVFPCAHSYSRQRSQWQEQRWLCWVCFQQIQEVYLSKLYLNLSKILYNTNHCAEHKPNVALSGFDLSLVYSTVNNDAYLTPASPSGFVANVRIVARHSAKWVIHYRDQHKCSAASAIQLQSLMHLMSCPMISIDGPRESRPQSQSHNGRKVADR